MKHGVGGMAAIVMLAGCMNPVASGGVAPAVGRADIRGGDGSFAGRATLTAESGATRVTVVATGLPPGPHGLHIHAVGRCDAPAFTTAGPHWNPTMKMHGRDNPMGPHVGDLPNLDIGPDGTGTVSFTLPSAPAALFDADGSAIVVHAAADDYKTDPSGNSGGRIACGVFATG